MTGVGAIRLLFSLPCSSDSEALLATLSLLTPAAGGGAMAVEPLSCACPGVCGGVNNGTDEVAGFEEPLAASPGTDPIDGVGLFIAGGGF